MRAFSLLEGPMSVYSSLQAHSLNLMPLGAIGCRVQGLVFRVQGLGFGGLGFRV